MVYLGGCGRVIADVVVTCIRDMRQPPADRGARESDGERSGGDDGFFKGEKGHASWLRYHASGTEVADDEGRVDMEEESDGWGRDIDSFEMYSGW